MGLRLRDLRLVDGGWLFHDLARLGRLHLLGAGGRKGRRGLLLRRTDNENVIQDRADRDQDEDDPGNNGDQSAR